MVICHLVPLRLPVVLFMSRRWSNLESRPFEHGFCWQGGETLSKLALLDAERQM